MSKYISGLLLLWLCTGCRAPAEDVVYLTAQVVRGPLVFQASFFGELRPTKSESIFIPALTDLWQVTIESLLADGTKVKKDDEVMRLDRSKLEDKLRNKRSELAVQEAELRQLNEALDKERINLDLRVKRLKLLVRKARLSVVEGVDFISKLELSKAKIDVSRAKLELQLARQARKAFAKKKKAALTVRRLKMASVQEKVKEYTANLEKMVIYAPADGVVYAPYTRIMWVMKKAAPGVVARPGDKILELPDLTQFNAEIYVRQRDAALLSVGDKATVFATTQPNAPIQAEVVKKDGFTTTRNDRMNTKIPEGNLKEVKIVLSLGEIPQGLRPGGTVRADVKSTIIESGLVAPLTALRSRGKHYSAVMADGSQRRVRIGKTSATHAEILDGLGEGDVLRLQ